MWDDPFLFIDRTINWKEFSMTYWNVLARKKRCDKKISLYNLIVQFNLQKRISDSFESVHWMCAWRRPQRRLAISWALETIIICNMEIIITWTIVYYRPGVVCQWPHLMPSIRLGDLPTIYHRYLSVASLSIALF